MNYRKKANLTLAAVFVFFVGAAALRHYYPYSFGISLLHFVSEAALVGGVADWFAVTAIFRKPLGWGYHTALIPRNREKVVEAVASMVQKELLSLDTIRKKIEQISFVDFFLKYVDTKGGTNFITNTLTTSIRDYVVEKQGTELLACKMAEIIRKEAITWGMAARIHDLGEWAAEHGYLDQGIDRFTEKLLDKASEEDTRQIIISYLEQIKQEKVANGGAIFRTLLGFIEMSDGLNLNEAAEALQVELLLTMRMFQDPQHPLRISLKETLLKSLAELERSLEFREHLEQWKNNVLADPLLENLLASALQIIFDPSSTVNLTASESNALNRALHPYIDQYWLGLKENIAFQKKINAFITDTLCQVIKNEHDLIGNIVRETLSTYNDQDLNQFIEDKAGNDLQWIRINGSMIGGIVGLILFLFLNFIYDPLITPKILEFVQIY